jgi:hypothetical protein
MNCIFILKLYKVFYFMIKMKFFYYHNLYIFAGNQEERIFKMGWYQAAYHFYFLLLV